MNSFIGGIIFMFYDMPSIYKNALQVLSATGQLGEGKADSNEPTETAKNI